MTHVIPSILADDSDMIMKAVFWAIVILIIVISKIVKFIGGMTSSKAASKPSDAPPAMRNTRRPPPLPAGAMALPPLPGKAAKTKRKLARRAPAVPPPVSPVIGIVSVLQQPRAMPAPPAVATPSRSRAAGWINARTIREQFILSEAMKPPVSLE